MARASHEEPPRIGWTWVGLSAWARWSSCGGAVAWLVCLALPLPAPDATAWITRAVQFAVLVLTPLGLALIAPTAPASDGFGLYRVAVVSQPPAGLLAALSVVPSVGIGAAALALPWGGCTALVALCGAWRLWQERDRADAATLCTVVGMLLLPVGGGWLVIARAGLDPGGFGPTLALLVALHYHYAGFATPLLAGSTGRRLAASNPSRPVRWWYRAIAVGVCTGSPLVAVGAVTTPLVEVVAVAVLTASLCALALLILIHITPRVASPLGRGLLTLSALAVFVPMLLALAYAGGNAIGQPLLTLAQMVRLHGAINAGGFALCGLLGWQFVGAAEGAVR